MGVKVWGRHLFMKVDILQNKCLSCVLKVFSWGWCPSQIQVPPPTPVLTDWSAKKASLATHFHAPTSLKHSDYIEDVLGYFVQFALFTICVCPRSHSSANTPYPQTKTKWRDNLYLLFWYFHHHHFVNLPMQLPNTMRVVCVVVCQEDLLGYIPTHTHTSLLLHTVQRGPNFAYD